MAEDRADGAPAAFREGFVAGARAILEGIGDDLAEEQKRVLQKWVATSLEDWRQAGLEAPQPVMPMIDGA